MKQKTRAGRPPLSETDIETARADIVAAARALFFDQGFSGVSMRNIAEHVGCSPMAIYRYFENKHALLREIWKTIFAEAHDALCNAIAGKRTPLSKLRAALSAYAAFWTERPHYFHIVYLTVDPNSLALGGVVLNEPDSRVRAVYEMLERLLADCVDAGRLKGDPALMLQIIVASLYGMALCVLTVPEFEWTGGESFAEEIVDRFIAGHSP